MSAMIRVYAPKGTEVSAIVNLMIGHGGFTAFDALGVWKDGELLHTEAVRAYECIVQCSLSDAKKQVEHAGRVFLNDNRNEKAFLGMVLGDGISQIYLEQS